MTRPTPEQYSRALQETERNYKSLRKRVVDAKIAKEEMLETLEEFHEPVISSIQETGGQLESSLVKQADAIENATESIQSIVHERRPAITYKKDEESDPDFYTPNVTPNVRVSKKRKLTSEVLSGHIDFDKPLLDVMASEDDFFSDFGLPKLNDIYKQVMEEENPEKRIERAEFYRDNIFPHLLKTSQSLGGKKKQTKVWKESDIRKLLQDSYLLPEQKLQLEERLRLLRQQKFIAEYRNSFKLLHANILNPGIVQVTYGQGCHIYTNLDDMVTRLVLIRGNIVGGNNSIEVLNEARAICDELFKHRAISKEQYKRLYQKFTPE